jgi:hypothetical protein
MFLKGLNDEIQFQLLNTDYLDFQHLVDKAIIIENKISGWKRMANARWCFWASILEATLGPSFTT